MFGYYYNVPLRFHIYLQCIYYIYYRFKIIKQIIGSNYKVCMATGTPMSDEVKTSEERVKGPMC